ncbi:hypothetical protein [Actinoplanes derwentensis]|uniref:Uncharacterized protein n=1 Tax=Actinoplanes derwentensis TaxID=113562 RepID=A0A1H1WS23_9ACTN|nr:hypothetical protein [Actinoplanes derwentensis]GID87010.1 hypothetical protein Ade03nite_59340 [Actinoplanes derwentensis]SDS99461.1 hypothetical protein SAMN04489716_2199 [Actinoplanes derwentensis]
MTDEPGFTAEHVIRPVSRRILAAGIAGLAGATTIGALWATEPGSLPTRTQAAFAGLIVVGLTWAGLAAWTLVRRPLFAADRVIGAWLAIVFSAATAVFSGVIAGPFAALPGLLLAVVAVVLLVRARAWRDRLRSQVATLRKAGEDA